MKSNIDNRKIFLAEDDLDDQELLTEALLNMDADIQVHIESSGEKAIKYLEKISDTELPCLIILDYNLPLVSGHQILLDIKNTDRFKNIIKVVWSTSNSPHYQKMCLDSGATAYFVKPSDMNGINDMALKLLGLCGHQENY